VIGRESDDANTYFTVILGLAPRTYYFSPLPMKMGPRVKPEDDGEVDCAASPFPPDSVYVCRKSQVWLILFPALLRRSFLIVH
jgi:hypothetical protein